MILPILAKWETEITVEDVFARLSRVMDPHHAKLIIGWTLGNFFMDLILDKYKVYPFLFFYGSAGSGKSTLANWVSSFFGFTIKGIPFGGGSTAVGIMRAANAMSMIPVWIEEYRTSDKDINNKNNMLRNIYDRSTIVKGSKIPDEIKVSTGRATLMISGEEMPRDAALNSRCIVIPVYRKEDTSTENSDFKWLQEQCPQFNGIGHYIMMNRSRLWEKINTRIQEYLDGFDADLQKASSRSKIHTSIVGAVCDVFLGQEEAFEHFMGKQAIDRTNFVHAAQALYVFLQDLINMNATGDLDITHFYKEVTHPKCKKAVAFWFSGAFKQWQERYAKFNTEMPMQEFMLREHLRHEPYFLESAKVRLGQKSLPLQSIILQADHPKFPELFTDLIEIRNKEIFEREMAGNNPKPYVFGEKND